MEQVRKYPRLLTLATALIIIAALYFARDVIIPIALAIVLSFLLAPLVRRLDRWRLNRLAATILAVSIFGLGAGAVGWLVTGQLRETSAKLTEYRSGLQEKVATLREHFEAPFRDASQTVQDLGANLAPPIKEDPSDGVIPVRIEERGLDSFEFLRDAFMPTVNILLTALIALLFAFVMLLHWDDLSDRLIRLVGQRQIPVTTQALAEASSKVSSYLIRFVLLNGIHGLLVAVGLTLIGVPNALLWGLLSAILRFIPYVGPWIAATCPFLTTLAVSEDWTQPLSVLGMIAFLELISNNFLEPWVYGRGTGITPLAVLVSTLFWTWLWGPVGLVLATPITVCLVVMSKYVPSLHFIYVLLGDAPALPPPARFYQRLVARDQDQAWSLMQLELQQRSLEEFYDSIVLPALSLAARDRQQGTLDEESEAHVVETVGLLLSEASDLVSPVPNGDPPLILDAMPLRVLCVPARGGTDPMAARMLAQVLARDGVDVEVARLDELSTTTLKSLESRQIDMVLISAVPPSRFVYVRYLCKQITARFPEMPIIVGMWALEHDSIEYADQVPSLKGVHVVTSLVEARERVRTLALALREKREPRTVPDVGSSDLGFAE